MRGDERAGALASAAGGLERVYGALQQVSSRGAARVLPVLGPHGVGKTRLLAEAESFLTEVVPDLTRYRVSFSSFATVGSALAPFGDLVRQRFGLGGGTLGPGAREVVRAAVAPIMAPGRIDETADILVWLANRTEPGDTDESGEVARLAVGALRNLMRHDARGPAHLILLDDADRALPGVLTLFRELVARMRDVPALFVASAVERPGALARLTELAAEESMLLGALRLDAWPPDRLERLLDESRGGAPPLSPPLRKATLELAAGLPGRVVGLMRELEQGAVTVEGWERAARAYWRRELRRLPPAAAALLGDCAHLGERFPEELLDALAGDVCATEDVEACWSDALERPRSDLRVSLLLRHGLLEEELEFGRSPGGGAAVARPVAFAHRTLREAALDAADGERESWTHALAAGWWRGHARLPAERLREAEHALFAGLGGWAADAFLSAAADPLCGAAERAARATRGLRALGLGEEAPPSGMGPAVPVAARLHARLSAAQVDLGDLGRAESAARAAAASAWRLRDEQTAAAAHVSLAGAALLRGELSRARKLANRAEALARTAGDEGTLVLALVRQCAVAAAEGADGAAARARTLATDATGCRGGVASHERARAWVAMAAAHVTDMNEGAALAALERAEGLLEEVDDRAAAADAAFVRSRLALAQGDVAGALAMAESGERAAELAVARPSVIRFLVVRALGMARTGRGGEALGLLAAAERDAIGVEAALLLAEVVLARARVALMVGDVGAALVHASRAVDAGRACSALSVVAGGMWVDAAARRQQADGQPSEAADALHREALRLLGEAGNAFGVACGPTGIGAAQGQPATARLRDRGAQPAPGPGANGDRTGAAPERPGPATRKARPTRKMPRP